MRFFTNRIVNPASSQNNSFDEYLLNLLSKTASEEKQAAEAKPGIGLPDANKDSRTSGKGQVINNDPLYQKGESTGKGKKEEKTENPKEDKKAAKAVVAKCGKEMGESHDAGKVTEKHTDAAPGDDKNKTKILINNDPNYQKGESTKTKKKDDKEKKSDKKEKKASSVNSFKKISQLNQTEQLSLFAVLSSKKEYTHLPFRTASGEKDKKPSLLYVEAITGQKFANMKEEEKSWFKDFWKTMYPEEYVEEMVSDR